MSDDEMRISKSPLRKRKKSQMQTMTLIKNIRILNGKIPMNLEMVLSEMKAENAEILYVV